MVPSDRARRSRVRSRREGPEPARAAPPATASAPARPQPPDVWPTPAERRQMRRLMREVLAEQLTLLGLEPARAEPAPAEEEERELGLPAE